MSKQKGGFLTPFFTIIHHHYLDIEDILQGR
jgi:hypothetical protein